MASDYAATCCTSLDPKQTLHTGQRCGLGGAHQVVGRADARAARDEVHAEHRVPARGGEHQRRAALGAVGRGLGGAVERAGEPHQYCRNDELERLVQKREPTHEERSDHAGQEHRDQKLPDGVPFPAAVKAAVFQEETTVLEAPAEGGEV